MTCPLKKGNTAIFIEYAAGSLTADEQAALERHFRQCPDCGKLAESQSEVWSALDGWAPPPVSPQFDELLYRRISEAEVLPWWKRMLGAGFVLPARTAVPVAVACVALVAAFLLRNPGLDRPILHPADSAPVWIEEKVSI